MVLAVAGTDSGGAAGLAADVATVGHHGAHAACVVTAVTAQDTTGVHAVHAVPVEVVGHQVDAVLADLPVAAVKTGMLGSAAVVDLVAERLAHLPLVVDPVLVATSGAVLGGTEVVDAYVRRLLPLCTVVTPNLAEARTMVGHDGPPPELAARLGDLGCAVVLTGGPEWRPGDRTATCTDWLCLPGGRPEPLTHPAVPTTADHGTGCTFSTALACRLAETRGHCPPRGGQVTREEPSAEALVSACLRAADYVAAQLVTSSTWGLGRGRGPIAHTAPLVPVRSRTTTRPEENR